MNLYAYYELSASLEREADSDAPNLMEVARVKAVAEQRDAAMDPVFEALSAKLYVRDPDDFADRFAEDESERAAADIQTLTSGNWRDGYWDPRLREFAEGPGRATLRSLITRCEKLLARHRDKASATFPAPYRYTGRGAHVVDGRLLKVGEVVMLTSEAQADALADRFAPVDEQVTS